MDNDTKLTLLQAMVHVIDVMASRGAVHGQELSEVGAIRQGLLEFIGDIQSSPKDVKDVAE